MEVRASAVVALARVHCVEVADPVCNDVKRAVVEFPMTGFVEDDRLHRDTVDI